MESMLYRELSVLIIFNIKTMHMLNENVGQAVQYDPYFLFSYECIAYKNSSNGFYFLGFMAQSVQQYNTS